MFDEFKKLAETAKSAQDKAYEMNCRFWDANDGKIPCSDEEFTQYELDYDNAKSEEQRTYQACLEYIDKITDELDFAAYKIGLPYDIRKDMMYDLTETLEKWLNAEYKLGD